jgi:hypothetical protein
LVFFFATLTALRSNSKHKWWLFAILGALTALSREYIAFVLFVTVSGYAILEKKNRFVSVVALFPALTIFLVICYPTALWILSSNSPFAISSFWWMVQDTFSIFAICFLPLLPFVIKGFSRDKLLDPMFGLLLLGSFSVVLIPWFTGLGYQRWLMLLAFPFSIYAVKGFERFQLFNKRRIWMLTTVSLIFMIIGTMYSTGVFSYGGLMPNSYVAVNLVKTSISWNEVDDVKAVLAWLDQNAVLHSSLLAEERFYGWTVIYLERASKDVKVIAYGAASSPMPTLKVEVQRGFSHIYLIWYTEGGLEDFEAVYSKNNISIFQYAPQVSKF